MRSVADRIRGVRSKQVRGRSASERLALALALGVHDLELVSRARRLTPNAAARLLQRLRRVGRTRSVSAGAPSR